MVPPDSTGISRVPAYLGTPAAAVLAFRVQDCHLLWSAVPGAFCYAFRQRIAGAPQPRRKLSSAGLGSSHFARRYSGNLY